MYIGNNYDIAYDKWLTTPPKDIVIHECEECGCEIYENEDYYEILDDIFCEECANNWLRKCRKVAISNYDY